MAEAFAAKLLKLSSMVSVFQAAAPIIARGRHAPEQCIASRVVVPTNGVDAVQTSMGKGAVSLRIIELAFVSTAVEWPWRLDTDEHDLDRPSAGI